MIDYSNVPKSIADILYKYMLLRSMHGAMQV